MSERRVSAAIAEQALTAVFGARAVTSLREDSPLSAVGMSAPDLVCLAEAVVRAGRDRQVTCLLDDAALDGLVTVRDLVDAVEGSMSPVAPATPAGAP